MMHKRMNRLAALLACAAMLFPILAYGQAQRSARFAPDAEIREAFDGLISSARAGVVELEVDGELRTLGTIVDAQGLILSKASELQGGEVIRAYLWDDRVFEAELVSIDYPNDLALLRIDAFNLHPVELVASEPEMGRWLACVGAERSPTAVGIVSAAARPIPASQLVLGVILREHPRGLRVTNLSPGFGAAEAGVRQGDVVTSVGGQEVLAVQQLVDRLQGQMDGDEIDVRLLRGEEVVRVSVRLSELEPDPRSRSERMNRMGGEVSERRRGFMRVLQHDAEIAPQQCGGPVVNLRGEVVGINIARAGRIATYALPSELLIERLAVLREAQTAPQQADPAPQPVSQPE